MGKGDKFTSHGTAWTRDGFLEALDPAIDRLLGARVFDLNGGTRESYCWFGTRPTGAVFLHPGGLKYSPLRVLAVDGVLMGQGTWTTYRDVRSHQGFAAMAAYLGQDHLSTPARFAMTQFDLYELWAVTMRCASEINQAVFEKSSSFASAAEEFDDDFLRLINQSVVPGQTVLTLSMSRPNRIISIDRDGLYVETERSANEGTGPQLVPAWMVNAAWQYLLERGRLTQTELQGELQVNRSAFVCALLAHFPDVKVRRRGKVALIWEGQSKSAELNDLRLDGYRSWLGAERYAAKLNHLFDTVVGSDGIAYSSDDVASALQADGIAVHSDSISRLREGTGGRPPERLASALAFFFDVDPDYFGDEADNEAPLASADLMHGNKSIEVRDPEAHAASGVAGYFRLSQAQFARILAAITQATSRYLEAESVDSALANRLALIVCDTSPLMLEAMSGEVLLPVGMADRIMSAWGEADPGDNGTEVDFLWAKDIFGTQSD